MKISDLLSMCVKNLTRRLFRTSMTIVGVIIGTCAIISTIALGIGMSKSTSDLIASWSDLTMIQVWEGNTEIATLDEKAVQDIQIIEGVDAATPFMRLPIYDGNIVAGKNGRYSSGLYSLVGVHPEALGKMGYTIETGTIMSGNSKKIQVVAGSNVAYSFEDTRRKGPERWRSSWVENPEDEIPEPFFDMLTQKDLQLLLKYDTDKTVPIEFEISGVLKDGGDAAYESREFLYIDIKDMNAIIEEYNKAAKIKPDKKQKQSYGDIKVRVKDIDKVSEIQKEIEALGFGTYSAEGERQNAMKQTQVLQIILGSLGGISLFVAAISIANTMVMSVYERTREIGIMKVLGCFVNNIRTMFLVEATIIGFSGGILGVLLSFLISFLLNRFGGKLSGSLGGMGMGMEMVEGATISIIPPWLVLLGLGFATLVGIVSGIYPAYRAVRISALEAIKQE